jgi:hypothetical protein
MMTRLPPDMACAIVRAAAPVIGEAHVVDVAKKVSAMGGKDRDD